MAVEKIIYTILPNGEVEVDVNGVKGSGCLKMTEHVVSALGDVKELSKKPEFYDGGSGVFSDINTGNGN